MPSGVGASQSLNFQPASITVAVGATVTWTNGDSAHHTVTSTSGPASFNSGDMGPGATFSFTFNTPGTYKYVCNYHSWMTGTITVTQG